MSKGVQWPEERERELERRVAAEESNADIAAAMGLTLSQVENKIRRLGLNGARGEMRSLPTPPPTDEFSREGKGDTEHLSSRSTRIKTLDDLLAYAEVDTEVWEVERYTVNKWEVGAKIKTKEGPRLVVEPLFQVKAWLRRNRNAERLREVGDRILAAIERHAPDYPAYPPAIVTRERYMKEWSAPDLHLGKLAWGPEAGDDWDLRIAREVYAAALEDSIEKASGFPTESFLVPIGNDFFQFDNLARTTTGGTPQDTDSRYAKMFDVGRELMVSAFDRLAAIAPVHAIVVPGNHDRQTALALGNVLAAWYRNTDRVTVDCGPKLRKYHRYGVNLLGFTHGSEEKHADLPLIMAQERARDWAETEGGHREWHIGHLHHKKETRFTAGDSFKGVRVRILPALCAADAWHASRGYIGEPRAAETYLWSFRGGYVGHFSSSAITPAKAA